MLLHPPIEAVTLLLDEGVQSGDRRPFGAVRADVQDLCRKTFR
jgi:hypothetical protein